MSELICEGDAAASEGRYEEALKLFSKAIEGNDKDGNIYLKRAEMFMKLKQYPDAHMDTEKACNLEPNNPRAFLNRGIALFHLEKVSKAKESFEKGKELTKEDKEFQSWIDKCNEKLSPKPKESKNGEKIQTQIPTQPVKQRYDWYQTETHVIVTIMIKKCKQEDVKVDFTDRTLSAMVKLPTGSDYSLELDLAHEITPGQSVTKVLTSKIEIKMKKAEGIRWNKLEGEDEIAKKVIKPEASAVPGDAVHKYPTSSHYTRNWDKIAKDAEEEEKKEESTGDAAVNNLFQKIYADGNDEVRRAMNKSFSESGGTVLSTNWNEISEKKTEVKPPDGMEFKKWEI